MNEAPEKPRIVGEYKGTRKRPVYFQLTEPVTVQLSDGSFVTVPAGYETNFASVPRLLWNVLPPLGVAVTTASLVHDFLYDSRKEPIDYSEKKRADREFLYLLQKYNEPGEIGNNIMYVAVKLFGRKQFRD